MSLEPSIDSQETTFWDTLEKIPAKLTQKLKKAKINSYLKSSLYPQNHHPRLLIHRPTKSSDYSTQRYSDTLQRLKEFKEEKLKIVNIVIVNQTKNEMKNSIVSIQQQFYQESENLNKQRDAMYEKFSDCSKVATNIISSFSEQKNVCRVFNVVIDELPYVPDSENLYKDIRDMRDQIAVYTERVEAMTVVHREYQEEAENSTRKAQFADEELLKLKENHEVAKKKLQKASEAKESKIREEIEHIRTNYESYKLKISQEMELRTLLESRQQQFIKQLLDELANMKVVLQHPTLRMRTYDRLQENFTPTDFSHTLPKLATQNLPSTRFNSNSHLGYFSSRSNNSNRRTKSSLKP